MAEVEVGTRSRLALRVPASYTPANARSAGDDIHFSLIREGKKTELSLTFLADGVLVMIPPGMDPKLCGPGTPRLIRPTAQQLMAWRAQELKGRVSRAYQEANQAMWNWLIDVL